MPKLAVGQKLWCVYGSGASSEIEVLKVGSRRATIKHSDNKIDMNTMEILDENFPVGRCWLSQKEWSSENTLREDWNRLRYKMPKEPPSGVTATDIAQARKLLGLGDA